MKQTLVINFPDFYNQSKIDAVLNDLRKSISYSAIESPTLIVVQNKFDLIRSWAKEKGIFDKGDVKSQFIKLVEEVGELAHSIDRSNADEFADAIGDCVVVLTSLAYLGGTSIEYCINSAYDEIKNRKGKMENGTFIKDGQ